MNDFCQVDVSALSDFDLVVARFDRQGVLRYLGSAAVECLLAERLVIGAHEAPRPGHLALLRKPSESKEERELVVIDDSLRWRRGGKDVAVDDHDYCLVRVERMATRNDYSSMEFHRLWVQARERMLARQPALGHRVLVRKQAVVRGQPQLTIAGTSAADECGSQSTGIAGGHTSVEEDPRMGAVS
jgi:hypothetical protein